MSSSDDEDDPIKVSYDVYIKPSLQNGRQLYVVQFPNRPQTSSYSQTNNAPPSELRIKPKSGLLELDVPIDAWHNYDREKGQRWGDAIKKSTAAGVSHGLPGGFGIGGAGIRARPGGDDEELQEQIGRDFNAAVTHQKVLVKQTLGGMMVPKDATSPTYMIGAFKKNQLHLTPVDQIVQMRPQFHHIDAAAELERQSRRADAGAVAASQGPRAIHMSIKAHGDDEEDTDTMAERIRAAQDEKWRKLNYVDEDSHTAWDMFNDDLFVYGGEDDDDDVSVDKVPKLVSSMDNAEYLDAISAPGDAARLAKNKEARIGKKGKDESVKEGDGVINGFQDEDEDVEMGNTTA